MNGLDKVIEHLNHAHADNFLENKLNALANGGQFSISYDITIP